MALIDQIREAAAQREGYNPLPRVNVGLGGLGTSAADLANVLRPTPVTPGVGGVPGMAGYGPGFSADDISKAVAGFQFENGAFKAPEPSTASKIFSGILDVVDTPRAAVVSGLKETWDALDSGDASFGEWWQQTRDNYRFRDLMNDKNAFTEERGWNPWVGATIGFIGDIAADPLTYATGGTVRGLTAGGRAYEAGRAAGIARAAAQAEGLGSRAVRRAGRQAVDANRALDAALRSGSRRGLAETIVKEAAKRNIVGEGVENLAREAGLRGRGAFTRKGLQRAAGADDQLLRELGLQADFGLTFGRGNISLNVGGERASRALAEMAENLKGNIKMAYGNSAAARKARSIFTGGDDVIGQAERRFVNEVLTGASSSADAARGLVAIKLAKAESYSWLDKKMIDVKRMFGKELPKLSDEDAIKLADDIERGILDNDLAQRLSGFYDDIHKEMVSMGLDFGYVDNYVNHLLTSKGKRAVLSGDTRLSSAGLNAAEAFQKTRTLKPGMEFLGETIPDIGLEYATIKQLNDIALRHPDYGYKLFEDDIRVLMSAYMAQAQKAHLRRSIYKAADQVDLNVSKAAKLNTELESAIKAQDDAIRAGMDARRATIKTANAEVVKARKGVASNLLDTEEKLLAQSDRLKSLSDKIDDANDLVNQKQAALQMWEGQLQAAQSRGRKALGAKKAPIMRKIKKFQSEIDDLNKTIDDATAQIKKLRGKKNEAARNALLKDQAELSKQLDVLTKQQGKLQKQYDKLSDPTMKPPNAKEQYVLRQKVQGANTKLLQARDRWLKANDAYTDAAHAFDVLVTDSDTLMLRLNNVLDNFDRVHVARQGVDGALAGELKARTMVVKQSLQDAGADPISDIVKKMESQALAHDMSAYKARQTARDASNEIVKNLSDPKFQRHMQRVLEDGFKMIDSQISVPKWFDEAFQSVPRSAEDWGKLRKFIEGHDKIMNVWKGWATTSPGFVWRNFYSGAFGMYLDGVSTRNVVRFNRLLRQYHEPTVFARVAGNGNRDFGLDAALKWGAQHGYSKRELEAFEEALRSASATGWGLTPQEVGSQLIGKRSWNPFSVEFVPTGYIRGKSSGVEALLRGSHGYDVILRGGDMNEAIRRVEMFHFNYRDISEFDRVAKRVMPFWTFYSRNMALQSQVWTRFPQKLNQSYFNLKKNLEIASEDDDTVVPSWFEELGAIRIPAGEGGGSAWYLTPDLPSLRFRQDLASITATGDEFNPVRLLSDTSPLVKTPVELLRGRSLFTNAPMRTDLFERGPDGQMVARQAPSLFQGEIPFTGMAVPGVSNLIKFAADKALAGDAEVVNGQLLMSDRAQKVIEDMIPLAGRFSRLDPNQQKYQERRLQSVLGFTGVPLRQNTPSNIRGEMYARSMDARSQAEDDAMRRLLERLTGNG